MMGLLIYKYEPVWQEDSGLWYHVTLKAYGPLVYNDNQNDTMTILVWKEGEVNIPNIYHSEKPPPTKYEAQ